MSLPPAHCVLSLANAGDVAGEIVCMVHTHVAPCPRNGEPASPSVIHTAPVPSRDRAVTAWELRTHRQRTLVIHVGELDESHDIGVNAVDCPCRPEVIWGRPCNGEKGAA